MTAAIILDTETTDIEGEVIELAYASCGGLPERAAALAGSTRRFSPSKPIAFGALATHHILPSELEGHEPSAKALSYVPAATYWIGHNIDFDWERLGKPPGIKRICTLAMSRNVWPSLDSHKLSALHYFLFGATPAVRSKLANAHSALHDVMLCAEVLYEILGRKKITSLEALYAFSEDARIPTIWGFGKFSGQPIGDADRGYANWYRKNCSSNPDYGYYCEALRRSGLA